MKIATRNLLAELTVQAFADPLAATVMRCLAGYCHTVKKSPASMTVERLLQPAPDAEREAVLVRLHAIPLLSWDLRGRSGRVTFASNFLAEWPEIAEKLLRCGAALENWRALENEAPLACALRKGAALFNHHLFFEVHEVLEAQWMRESGDEKQFLQGLIQIAVAFYHVENHNLRGARSLLQDGIDKIAPYRPAFLGVELTEFLQSLEECQMELGQLGEEELAQFDKKKIPRLRMVEQKQLH